MSSINVFSGPLAQALGWALLHLLWQGAVVAGILAATLALLSKQRANVRYAVSCGALALLLVLGVATAYRVYDPVAPQQVMTTSESGAPQPVAITDVPKMIIAAAAGDTWREKAASFAVSAQASLPWIVLLWLTGVVVLSSRLIVSWRQTQHIARRNAVPAKLHWQRTAVRLADALGLRRAITLLESTAVEVPSVIGWLRPVILLPTSTLTGLTPEQIEMVLAHELAHIRRNDFFVNLLQAVVETLMFYHPAVWWMSSRVRIEREHCCDDLAVAVCGNPLQYARALTRLEELRAEAPLIAVAANGGSLLDRIRRIATTRDEATAATSRWAAAIAVLSIIGIAMVVPAIPALAQREETKARAAVAAKAAEAAVDVVEPAIGEIDLDLGHLDNLDVDLDIDPVVAGDLDYDFDFEAPEAPEPPDAPELPDLPDMPELAHIPDVPEAPHVPMIAVISPRAPHAPQPPMIMATLADIDANWDHSGDADDEREEAKRDPSGKLTVDELIRLRNHGVTPEFIKQMRVLFPTASVSSIANARAVGVRPEYVQQMRENGLKVDSLRDATRLAAIGVTTEYIRGIRATYPDATADDIAQARAVGVTADYAKQFAGSGIEVKTLDEARHLAAVGVRPEYIRDMRAAGVDIKTSSDVKKLAAMGVKPEFVKQLAAAGYTNLSVRELTRLAAAGVDGDFIRDMQQYKDKK